MSSVLRPRGPQKSSVYWRRRAVALLVVLAVPLLLVVLVVNGLSSEPEQQAQPEPEASGAAGEIPADPEPEPSAEPEPEPEAEAAAEAEAEAAAAEAAEPAAEECADDGIAVAVSLDAEAYPGGANPSVTMTITNASGSDCLRDIGPGANEIVITSGDQHVWSSDDCDPSQNVDEQVLPAGVDAATTVTWERVLSAPGCGGSGAAAQPGTYFVEGRNGSVVSEPVRFVLQ
jgi:hypothetical protein